MGTIRLFPTTCQTKWRLSGFSIAEVWPDMDCHVVLEAEFGFIQIIRGTPPHHQPLLAKRQRRGHFRAWIHEKGKKDPWKLGGWAWVVGGWSPEVWRAKGGGCPLQFCKLGPLPFFLDGNIFILSTNPQNQTLSSKFLPAEFPNVFPVFTTQVVEIIHLYYYLMKLLSILREIIPNFKINLSVKGWLWIYFFRLTGVNRLTLVTYFNCIRKVAYNY